jgi:hypothetical protein
MLRFVLGTLALLGTLFSAFVIEGGDPIAFLLPSPLMIVVGVPCFAVLAVWSLKDWGRAWKDAFRPTGREGTAPSAEASGKIWEFYEKACYVAGVVSFILGLNVILSSRGEVRSDDLSRPLSVDCVAPILAILFAMVARILRARVEKSAT